MRRGDLGYETVDGADCFYNQETGEKVYEKPSPNTGDGDSAYGWFVYSNGADHDRLEHGVNTDFFIHLTKNVGYGFFANSGNLSYNEIDSIMNKLKSTAQSIGSIDMSTSTTKSCTSTWSIVDPNPPVSSPVQPPDTSPVKPPVNPPVKPPTTVTEPSDCPGNGSCPDRTGKLEVGMLMDQYGDVDNFWYVKKGKRKVVHVKALNNATLYEWCSCLPTGKYKYFICDREKGRICSSWILKMRWNGKQKLKLNVGTGKWSKKKKNMRAK